jgi:hypothetical protein
MELSIRFEPFVVYVGGPTGHPTWVRWTDDGLCLTTPRHGPLTSLNMPRPDVLAIMSPAAHREMLGTTPMVDFRVRRRRPTRDEFIKLVPLHPDDGILYEPHGSLVNPFETDYQHPNQFVMKSLHEIQGTWLGRWNAAYRRGGS